MALERHAVHSQMVGVSPRSPCKGVKHAPRGPSRTHCCYRFTQGRGRRPLDKPSGRTKTIQTKRCMTVLFSATRGLSWCKKKIDVLKPPKVVVVVHFAM